MADDLPALERPANATSGAPPPGSWCQFAAVVTNSALWNGCFKLLPSPDSGPCARRISPDRAFWVEYAARRVRRRAARFLPCPAQLSETRAARGEFGNETNVGAAGDVRGDCVQRLGAGERRQARSRQGAADRQHGLR